MRKKTLLLNVKYVKMFGIAQAPINNKIGKSIKMNVINNKLKRQLLKETERNKP